MEHDKKAVSCVLLKKKKPLRFEFHRRAKPAPESVTRAHFQQTEFVVMHGRSCLSGLVTERGRGGGHKEEEEGDAGGWRLYCWQVIYNPLSFPPLHNLLQHSITFRRSKSIRD